MPAFEAKCSMMLEGDSLLELHEAITEFASLIDEQQGVLEAFFQRRDGLEDVEFLLEADDEARAIALAEALIAKIEREASERFGKGAVRPGGIAVQPEGDAAVAILDELSRQADAICSGDLLAELEDDCAGASFDDPYEAMKEAETCGASYDLDTDDIIARFRSWEQTTSLDVVDVGSSFVTVLFRELPDDVVAFAEEAYALCPDLADDVEELDDVDDDDDAKALALKGIARLIREERALRFWWD